MEISCLHAKMSHTELLMVDGMMVPTFPPRSPRLKQYDKFQTALASSNLGNGLLKQTHKSIHL